MKKILAISIALIVMFSSTSFASFDDVSEVSYLHDSIERITYLGLMDAMGGGYFKPEDPISRGQFSKAVTIASGNWDAAQTMKGSTRFADVDYDGQYNGYINVCLEEGYMTGLADGGFGPDSPVTFAQAVTAMIRVLGYTDADIPGMWPKNYMERAIALGLTDGLPAGTAFKADSEVSRSVMAQMLSNLLDTKLNSPDPQSETMTLAEASGLTAGSIYTVYSKPEVFLRSKLLNTKIGDIDLGGGVSIVKNSVDNSTEPAAVTNGEAITIDDIEDHDIVYQVSDKSGRNRYILVINNQVTGILTGIMPNKYTPQKIEVDGTLYELDKNFITSKLTSNDSYKLDDSVSLMLGYDGKVVDIKGSIYEDNSNFAFVVNYTSYLSSDDISDGQRRYTVDLLLINGKTATFDTSIDPSPMKGRLISYTENADKSVALTRINYTSYGKVNIDKQNRKILSYNNYYYNDITENVKIFDLISNETGKDAVVKLMNWAELPEGVIESDKVLYLNKTGQFEDVNVILLDNAVSHDYYFGIVKGYSSTSLNEKETYTINILIEDKEYTFKTFTNYRNIKVGSVVKVGMLGNDISGILEIMYPDTQFSVIQAVDDKRIRVNNRTYTFARDKIIYLMDYSGSIKSVLPSGLKTNTLYNQAAICTDVSYTLGGKAELIIVRNFR